MFVDLPLARCLERAEGLVGASFVDARQSTEVEWRELGGAIVNFDGVASPMTQTFGLGLHGEIDLPAIEEFFNARGADTLHEVSPHAGVELFAQLTARGYHPIELSNVLVQPVRDAEASPQVRAIDPAVDGEVWIETAIAGWSTDPTTLNFIRDIAELAIRNRRMTQYLVEHDGQPVATASLGIEGDVALLAGASTIPEARKRGAQAALLSTRLADARRRGCTVAMIVASVGSVSQRNAEREGFRVAYTRTKWRRPRAS